MSYQPKAKDTDTLIQELLEKLAETPEGGSMEAVLTDSIFVTDYALESGQLSLHFDPAYKDMNGIREILCRSAVVRTPLSDPGCGICVLSDRGQPADGFGKNRWGR